jgi:ABC-type dipeptide/oligopeptide/nickel transport system, ATPase component
VVVQAAIVDCSSSWCARRHDAGVRHPRSGAASGIADRIAVMDAGRLVELGPAARVVSDPEAVETAVLIAAHIDLSTPPLVGEAP